MTGDLRNGAIKEVEFEFENKVEATFHFVRSGLINVVTQLNGII